MIARRLRSPLTLEDFAGRECACVRYDLLGETHLLHSEGLRESCDIVLDHSANILHPQRRIGAKIWESVKTGFPAELAIFQRNSSFKATPNFLGLSPWLTLGK